MKHISLPTLARKLGSFRVVVHWRQGSEDPADISRDASRVIDASLVRSADGEPVARLRLGVVCRIPDRTERDQ